MINSIEALNGSKTTYTQQTSNEPSDEITYDDFMNLLVTQLKYQDPLDPMDNNQFIAQTTGFTQLEELTKMSASMDDLVESLTSTDSSSDKLLAATSFIGKEVTYSSTNIELVEGSADLKFNLTASAVDTNVTVYDSLGNQVAMFTPQNLATGENNITWDGVSDDGAQLGNGIYTYQVNATDANGDDVGVWTFAKGVVDGVSAVSGNLLMSVGNQQVDYNLIYSVFESTDS